MFCSRRGNRFTNSIVGPGCWVRPSPTLSTSDARRPFFALGDMDVILHHSQEALTDINVLFVVRLLGKFRGTPEKVRWIRHGVVVEGMRGKTITKEFRSARTQSTNLMWLDGVRARDPVGIP